LGGEIIRLMAPEIGGEVVLLRAEKFESIRNLLVQPSSLENPENLAGIPPGILRSQQAFWRDLPELLKNKKNHGKWVAYHGDERIGIAASDEPLIRECIRRGVPDDEYYLAGIRPRELPPWEPEEIEPGGHEVGNVELFNEPGDADSRA
jgi:hypothetical protein